MRVVCCGVGWGRALALHSTWAPTGPKYKAGPSLPSEQLSAALTLGQAAGSVHLAACTSQNQGSPWATKPGWSGIKFHPRPLLMQHRATSVVLSCEIIASACCCGPAASASLRLGVWHPGSTCNRRSQTCIFARSPGDGYVR